MAAIMSLIRSAQLKGLDPIVYLKDVRTRLPTHKANDIDALRPYRWHPLSTHLNSLVKTTVVAYSLSAGG